MTRYYQYIPVRTRILKYIRTYLYLHILLLIASATGNATLMILGYGNVNHTKALNNILHMSQSNKLYSQNHIKTIIDMPTTTISIS